MKEIVRHAIERIYMKKEYDYFKMKCAGAVELSQGFYELLGEKYEPMFNNSTTPALTYLIYFDDAIKGEVKVEYQTRLQISKITPVFYIQHEFSIDNFDPDGMSPVLDGFSNAAYCKNQFEFHEKISEHLINYGYTELTYSEMEEVIPELEMPMGVTIFGSQVTVGTALFLDVFNLCEVPD